MLWMNLFLNYEPQNKNMVMEIRRNGRLRMDRGVLNSFNELPIEKQEVFQLIKKELKHFLGEDADVYVFGSHYWGFWDDQSDYDVRIFDKTCDRKLISNLLMEKHKIKVDLLIINEERKGILIP